MNDNTKKESFVGKIPLYIGCIGLTMAIVLTSINTFTRYFFSYTYAGTSEIISVAFMWTVFGGAAYAYKLGQHYGIDLLVNALPESAKKIVGFIAKVLLVVIFSICTYLAVKYTINVHDSPMPATHLSYSVYFSGAIYGFGMMTIYAVKDLVLEIMGLISKKGGDEK